MELVGPSGLAPDTRPPGLQQTSIVQGRQGRTLMRTVYKGLAYFVAIEVAVQAMAAVWAIAGLGKWVEGGGVVDKALMESEGMPFPEVAGFIVHGINGTFVIPGIALLLLITSFFARVRGAIKWAVIVFVLVVVQ